MCLFDYRKNSSQEKRSDEGLRIKHDDEIRAKEMRLEEESRRRDDDQHQPPPPPIASTNRTEWQQDDSLSSLSIESEDDTDLLNQVNN